jgi:hypothetical protein
MGLLARKLIKKLKSGRGTSDDLPLAADLMAKAVQRSYVMNDPELDREIVTAREAIAIKKELVRALKKSNKKFQTSGLIWALSKSGDMQLRSLYLKYLDRYLREIRHANHGLGQTLIALERAGELKELPDPSPLEIANSVDRADRNIIVAWKYLKKRGIVVPL